MHLPEVARDDEHAPSPPEVAPPLEGRASAFCILASLGRLTTWQARRTFPFESTGSSAFGGEGGMPWFLADNPFASQRVPSFGISIILTAVNSLNV